MNIFKESYLLVKWLFSSRPSDVVSYGLKVVHMDHFPFRGYKYMMWCGKIITRQDKDATISEMLYTTKGKVSYNHERIHAYQACYACNDSWLRYYWSYLINWLRHNPIVHPGSAAYYCNKYEVEAYANEENLTYCNTYASGHLRGKYAIRDAKKKFRRMGCSVAEWMYYIKKL